MLVSPRWFAFLWQKTNLTLSLVPYIYLLFNIKMALNKGLFRQKEKNISGTWILISNEKIFRQRHLVSSCCPLYTMQVVYFSLVLFLFVHVLQILFIIRFGCCVSQRTLTQLVSKWKLRERRLRNFMKTMRINSRLVAFFAISDIFN